MDRGVLGSEGPNPVDRHVGMKIRLRRKALGLSQELLAHAIGLTFQQVQKYERGTNRVSASKLWEICKVLDVRPTYFFEGLDAGRGREASAPQPDPDPMYMFMALPEACDLVDAYLKVPPGPLRRQVLGLIRALAEILPRH